ncbi:hypothetical protein ACFXBB_30020 [Streptomyces scopuliridis]|uniref:hypothetical protein n=1 Tax=Streptomyces scopuliridis TaxID=452529 RepID=UPI00367704D2
MNQESPGVPRYPLSAEGARGKLPIGRTPAVLPSERRRWERLVAGPSLVRTAVEEALRFDADPGFGMPRHVEQDIEVAETPLPRELPVRW